MYSTATQQTAATTTSTNLFNVSTVFSQNLSLCLLHGLFSMRACCHACHCCAHAKSSKSIPWNTHTRDTNSVYPASIFRFNSSWPGYLIHNIPAWHRICCTLHAFQNITRENKTDLSWAFRTIFDTVWNFRVRKNSYVPTKENGNEERETWKKYVCIEVTVYNLLIYGEFFGCLAKTAKNK